MVEAAPIIPEVVVATLAQLAPPKPPRFDGQRQICGKSGHLAVTYWHKGIFQYNTPTSTNDVAFLANNSTTDSTLWYLDSGATSHLSLDLLPFQQPYNGKDNVLVGNGTLFQFITLLMAYNPHQPVSYFLNHYFMFQT